MMLASLNADLITLLVVLAIICCVVFIVRR